MIYKRKLFKKKQLLVRHLYQNNELFAKIRKSLFRNHYIKPISRLSFNIENLEPALMSSNIYINTFQKMYCQYTLCKKVPSKQFLFSRFFLNKQLNTLKINNVLKSN